jgi:hypothetical protein
MAEIKMAKPKKSDRSSIFKRMSSRMTGGGVAKELPAQKTKDVDEVVQSEPKPEPEPSTRAHVSKKDGTTKVPRFREFSGILMCSWLPYPHPHSLTLTLTPKPRFVVTSHISRITWKSKRNRKTKRSRRKRYVTVPR